MPKLLVVFGSTRPARAGLPIATWFVEHAAAHGAFTVELADLQEVGLPLFDEPEHPRLGHYQHAHTRAWSARVASADALVFVTPEYNHGPPPAIINALAYLHKEWAGKPLGFVSYGGISGGIRAVQSLKPIVSALKLVPLFESVPIPHFTNHVKPGEPFAATDSHRHMATAMLAELARWEQALRPLRG